MAPIRPVAKTTRNAKATTTTIAAVKQHTTYPTKSTDSAFSSTKRDKRLIKHSILMSKIHEAGVKKNKRRRPGKKLVANLDSLEDALQDVKGGKKELSSSLQTIKGGRGQAKRREKVLKEERQRFGKNLAILSQAGSAVPADESGTNNRWANLRAHIQASMPQGATEAG